MEMSMRFLKIYTRLVGERTERQWVREGVCVSIYVEYTIHCLVVPVYSTIRLTEKTILL